MLDSPYLLAVLALDGLAVLAWLLRHAVNVLGHGMKLAYECLRQGYEMKANDFYRCRENMPIL
jgi:hypothetical protein